MFDISLDSVCYVIGQARALALGQNADDEAHDPDAHGRENLIHGDTDDDELIDDREDCPSSEYLGQAG